MYAALWRTLPGPVWVKLILLLALIVLVLAACYFFVFPWVNSLLGTPDVTVNQ